MYVIYVPVIAAIVLVVCFIASFSMTLKVLDFESEVYFFPYCDYKGTAFDGTKEPSKIKSIAIPYGMSVTLYDDKNQVTFTESLNCFDSSLLNKIVKVEIQESVEKVKEDDIDDQEKKHHHHHHHSDEKKQKDEEQCDETPEEMPKKHHHHHHNHHQHEDDDDTVVFIGELHVQNVYANSPASAYAPAVACNVPSTISAPAPAPAPAVACNAPSTLNTPSPAACNAPPVPRAPAPAQSCKKRHHKS